MDETETTRLILKGYAKASTPVSQQFYQGLCAKAAETIEQLQQKLADYKEGCEGLKDAVSDLRNERDKFEGMLKIILRNIRGKAVSIYWIKNYIASFIASDRKDTATIKKEEQDILKRRRIDPNGSSQKDV